MSSVPGWPSVSDYHLAMQNISETISEPDLARARVLVDRYGLPRYATGNFAVVFRVDTSVALAVKCFTRRVISARERYQALSDHFARTGLVESFVDCRYSSRGILISGDWYPIVRMAWVSGQRLDSWVDDHLQDSSELIDLVGRWLTVVKRLRDKQIAHGDLQHGNILVGTDGLISLVDYDGCYVPSLAGSPSDEVGHPNFQHPNRTRNGYYAGDMDTFSEAVICLSLLALAADPDLWRFSNGENLIFTAHDFESPGTTKVWQHLRRTGNSAVTHLAGKLERACSRPVSELDELIDAVLNIPAAAKEPRTSPLRERPDGRWWRQAAQGTERPASAGDVRQGQAPENQGSPAAPNRAGWHYIKFTNKWYCDAHDLPEDVCLRCGRHARMVPVAPISTAPNAGSKPGARPVAPFSAPKQPNSASPKGSGSASVNSPAPPNVGNKFPAVAALFMVLALLHLVVIGPLLYPHLRTSGAQLLNAGIGIADFFVFFGSLGAVNEWRDQR